MNVIDKFLEKWKIEALNYYVDRHNEYLKLEDDKSPLSDSDERFLRSIGYANTRSAPNYYRKVAFLHSNFGKNWKMHDIMKSNDPRFTEAITQIVEKEAIKKKNDFNKKIETKVGKVHDAQLYIGVDTGINGYIEGEKGRFNVETIYAGGYNIQRLHYRFLIKKIKK